MSRASQLALFADDIESAGGTFPAGGGGVTSYSNVASFSDGTSIGDFAFAEDTKSLYVWDGSAWDRVYSGAQQSVEWTSSLNSSYNYMAGDSASTLTVEAIDPDGFPINYEFTTDPANTASANITQGTGANTNQFTITPNSKGTFTLRVTADDGVSKIKSISTINILADVIVDQTSTYTTPLQNADVYSIGNGLAGSTYSGVDYSWTLSTLPNSFYGFRRRIDWNVDEVVTAGSEILFAVACSGFGGYFNQRGFGFMGFQNADYTKNIQIGRYDYNPDDTNYFYATADGISNDGATTGVYRSADTSSATSNWYMAIRLNTTTGAVKGWVSYDSGSNWSEKMYGTYANVSDLTHALITIMRREGTGSKIALLDANDYKSTLVL